MPEASDLVERTHELEAVERLVRATLGARGSALLFEGSPGSGKTSLLNAAAARFGRSGATVVRGIAQAGQPPWELIGQLGAQLADAPNSESGDEPGPASPQLLAEPPGPTAAASYVHRVCEAVARAAAERPIALVVDDLQDADASSVRALRKIVARSGELPVAVVAAARDDRNSDPVVLELLDRLRTDPSTAVLSVAPLSRDAVGVLARRVLGEGGDERVSDALTDATAGNPFLCRQLLLELERHGPRSGDPATWLTTLRPSSVRAWIRLRLARCGHTAERLASATAVLSRSATAVRAGAVAKVDADDAARALDLLIGEHLLVDGGDGGLAFVHPIVGEIVEAGLGPIDRQRLHARAATVLRDAGSPASTVAVHLLASGSDNLPCWAPDVLRTAARIALAHGANGHGCRLLRVAVGAASGPLRRQLELELARGMVLDGSDEASDWVARALALASDDAEAGEVDGLLLVELGDALFACGRYASASEAFAIGLQNPQHHDELVRARMLAGSRASSVVAGHPDDEVGARVVELTASPPSDPTPADRILLGIAAGDRAMRGEGPHDVAVALARSSLNGESVPGAVGRVALEPAIAALLWSDALLDGREQVDRLLDRARTEGTLPIHAGFLTFRSFVHAASGPVFDATSDARAALGLLADLGEDSADAWHPARWALVSALLELDDLTAARDAVEETSPALTVCDSSALRGYALHARGQVALALGDVEEARRAFLEAGEAVTAVGATGTLFGWRGDAANACWRCGLQDEAETLIEEERRIADAYGAPRAIAVALRHRATIGERIADSVELLRSARELLVDHPASVELARTQLALGAAMRRGGWDRDARKPLRAALDEARRSGAARIARRATIELEATGAKRVDRALSGVGALTPSQRRVVELAAAGWPNGQIAAELVVTRRTVEAHLTAAYRKLGVEGRDELPQLSTGEKNVVGPQ